MLLVFNILNSIKPSIQFFELLGTVWLGSTPGQGASKHGHWQIEPKFWFVDWLALFDLAQVHRLGPTMQAHLQHCQGRAPCLPL